MGGRDFVTGLVAKFSYKEVRFILTSLICGSIFMGMEPTKLAIYLVKQKEATQRYQSNLRDKALAILGGRCANPNCGWVNEDGTRGCKDKRCLQIDHKKGFGGIDRKRWKSQEAQYRFIIHNLAREEWFQILCCNCNTIKKIVNGECKGAKAYKVELPPIPAEDLKEVGVPVITKPQDNPALRPIRYWVAGQEVWKAYNAKKEPVEYPLAKVAEDEIYDPEWMKIYYSEVLPGLIVP